MENVFDAKDAQNYIDRINKLVEDTHGLWGKMTVDQMLAHCSITYEMVYEPEKHKKPGAIAKFILKTFVKPKVVGEKAYPRDSPTAPQFLITGRKNFQEEKTRLIGFIQKTQQLGAEAFDGKESFSFGKLNAQEWNNMFAKTPEPPFVTIWRLKTTPMKKFLLLFLFAANFVFGQNQMPDISSVWLNGSKPYTGTIGKNGQELKLKINTSEQNKKNDQEYFVSGYSLVDTNYAKFEGKLTISKYKDSKRQGTIFGEYELAEENKGKHSGLFKGKFVYNFKWNRKTEKIEGQYIEFTGDWKSYDGTMDFKTNLKNQ